MQNFFYNNLYPNFSSKEPNGWMV